jgi:hypothetical protein
LQNQRKEDLKYNCKDSKSYHILYTTLGKGGEKLTGFESRGEADRLKSLEATQQESEQREEISRHNPAGVTDIGPCHRAGSPLSSSLLLRALPRSHADLSLCQNPQRHTNMSRFFRKDSDSEQSDSDHEDDEVL